MQSLYSISTFYYSTPEFYRISQINKNEYYIEPKDRNIRRFKMKKYGNTWIAEGGYTEFQAAQIGEIIERSYRNAFGSRVQ
ncbi:MAG: hypothetical protein ABIN89_13175 [Chitinophagaceae bacterium]